MRATRPTTRFGVDLARLESTSVHVTVPDDEERMGELVDLVIVLGLDSVEAGLTVL